MSFLTNILGAVVKTALLPVAIVKDVATGDLGEATGTVGESAVESVEDALDDLLDGDLL